MKCPNCDFVEKYEAFGQPPTCPKCGAIYEKALRVRQLKELQVKKLKAAVEKKAQEQQPTQEQAAPAQSAEPAAESQRLGVAASISAGIAEAREERQREADEIVNRVTSNVVITDVQIPFLSLVALLFKVMMAAIPASVAFYIAIMFVFGIIGQL